MVHIPNVILKYLVQVKLLNYVILVSNKSPDEPRLDPWFKFFVGRDGAVEGHGPYPDKIHVYSIYDDLLCLVHFGGKALNACIAFSNSVFLHSWTCDILNAEVKVRVNGWAYQVRHTLFPAF